MYLLYKYEDMHWDLLARGESSCNGLILESQCWESVDWRTSRLSGQLLLLDQWTVSNRRSRVIEGDTQHWPLTSACTHVYTPSHPSSTHMHVARMYKHYIFIKSTNSLNKHYTSQYVGSDPIVSWFVLMSWTFSDLQGSINQCVVLL